MDGKRIRLVVAEPAEASDEVFGEIREFVEKVRGLLADAGWDLQVAFWGGSGYERVMLRMKRLCPEMIAGADLCLFLVPERGDPFLPAEYSAAEELASSGSGPVPVRCVPDSEAGRCLLDALAERFPSLPISSDEDGRVFVAGTAVLEKKRIPLSFWNSDDSYCTCHVCGAEMERYEDWLVCPRCNAFR